MNCLSPLRMVEGYHELHKETGHQFSFVAKICVRAMLPVVTLNATCRRTVHVKGSVTCLCFM